MHRRDRQLPRRAGETAGEPPSTSAARRAVRCSTRRRAACCVTDADGMLLEVNETFCSWTGLRGRRAGRPAHAAGPADDGRADLSPDPLGAAAADAGLGLRGQARRRRTPTARQLPMLMNAVRRERRRRRVHEIAAIVAPGPRQLRARAGPVRSAPRSAGEKPRRSRAEEAQAALQQTNGRRTARCSPSRWSAS